MNDDEPRPVRAALDDVLRGLGNPGVAAVRTVFSDWTALVGEETAAHAKPVSLDGGCLLVVVDEPAWATRFRYEQAPLLRGRIGRGRGDPDRGARPALKPPRDGSRRHTPLVDLHPS